MLITQVNVHSRNLSGFYTTDFPDFPPSFFNFTALDVPDNATDTVQGTKVKMLDYNEEVEIVFQGTNVFDALEDHPMHLHGYTFYVVGSGGGNFDTETDPKCYNLVDPPKMNTVSLPKNGWVALRFKASNPGMFLNWFSLTKVPLAISLQCDLKATQTLSLDTLTRNVS